MDQAITCAKAANRFVWRAYTALEHAEAGIEVKRYGRQAYDVLYQAMGELRELNRLMAEHTVSLEHEPGGDGKGSP